MESINEHEDEHPVEPVTDNHKKEDPFVNIDNIADLTLDEVREILEKEEASGFVLVALLWMYSAYETQIKSTKN